MCLFQWKSNSHQIILRAPENLTRNLKKYPIEKDKSLHFGASAAVRLPGAP